MEFTIKTEEKDEALSMLQASHCLCALDDFKDYLRSLIKHRELTEEQSTIVDEIRDRFFEDLGQFLN